MVVVATSAAWAEAFHAARRLPAALPGTPDLETVLVRACATALVVSLGWLWLGVVLTAAEAVGGVATRWAPPAALRRGVLACCGVALAAPAPAYAGAGHGLAGLPLPERVTVSARPHAATPPAPATRPRGLVVVRPGDTLWSLAAAGLPVNASSRAISERWHLIYAANRSLIGDDPDLLRVGLRLAVPPTLRKDVS